MEIEIKFKTDKELKEEKKKPKSISSFSDLRKLFEDEDPKLSHGTQEFGSTPKVLNGVKAKKGEK